MGPGSRYAAIQRLNPSNIVEIRLLLRILSFFSVVSAPGKVLVTGGYLVLDREFEGMPVATDSRFYACIKSAGAAKSTGDILGRIIVVSPQFASAEWSYDVQDSGEGKLLGLVPTGSSKNPYLANALIFSLSLASAYPGFREKLASGLKIVVLGGNDFYSQATNLESRGLPRTASGLAQIEPFAQLGPLSGVAKTGLGSSAALVTSVVLAVLSYFGTISLSGPTAEKGRRVGHATAQLAHCLAQGKVGSGFDVASAVYGSGVYRRFDPEVVARLIKVCWKLGTEIPCWLLTTLFVVFSNTNPTPSPSQPSSRH